MNLIPALTVLLVWMKLTSQIDLSWYWLLVPFLAIPTTGAVCEVIVLPWLKSMRDKLHD